jgi:hypothetical protein
LLRDQWEVSLLAQHHSPAQGSAAEEWEAFVEAAGVVDTPWVAAAVTAE